MKMLISALTSLSVTLLLSVDINDPIYIDLDDYRWEHRVIILFTDELDDSDYLELKSQILERPEEISDRDLKVITISEMGSSLISGELINEKSAEQLRDRLNSDENPFRVILIGKDGGVKMDRTEKVSLTEINSIIDRMPMRRQEMRRSSSQK